jgi:hypothetical protein
MVLAFEVKNQRNIHNWKLRYLAILKLSQFTTDKESVEYKRAFKRQDTSKS